MAHRSIHHPVVTEPPPPVDGHLLEGEPGLAPVGPWPLRVSLSTAGAVAHKVLERPARVAGFAVVACLAVAAGWWLLRPAPAPVESSLPVAAADSPAANGGGADPAVAGASTGGSGTTSTTVAELVVQAAGQVVHPGVYRLDPSARVDDLVRDAGGLTPRADRDRINLAAPLADGERVWIPARGEAETPEVIAGTGGGSSGGPVTGAGATSSGGTPPSTEPVDLNAATAEQLDALPGVGPATASAILAYREQSGGFRSVDDLLEVRGIGDAKMEQLRPLVRV